MLSLPGPSHGHRCRNLRHSTANLKAEESGEGAPAAKVTVLPQLPAALVAITKVEVAPCRRPWGPARATPAPLPAGRVSPWSR